MLKPAGIRPTSASPRSSSLKGLEIHEIVKGAMMMLGDKWRKHNFASLGKDKDRLKKIMTETSPCIACYSCISACPICSCVDCPTKDPAHVMPWEVPPNFMST